MQSQSVTSSDYTLPIFLHALIEAFNTECLGLFVAVKENMCAILIDFILKYCYSLSGLGIGRLTVNCLINKSIPSISIIFYVYFGFQNRWDLQNSTYAAY